MTLVNQFDLLVSDRVHRSLIGTIVADSLVPVAVSNLGATSGSDVEATR